MTTETTVWGVHMGLAHELRPIEHGYIAIGWKAVGNLSSIAPTREAFKAAVAAAYPQSKAGAVPVHAGTLFKFATE